MKKKQKKILARIIISAALTVIFNLIPITGIVRLTVFLGIYLLIGFDILRKAALGIIHGRLLDENFLMSIATVGAFALAIYTGSGDFNEAIAVMLFYQVGEFFQSYAVDRSRKNIGALMNIRPDSATLERDGELIRVSPNEVTIGSIIVVGVGERIPIDGVIIEGSSLLDTSSLTGESVPREAGVGDRALSGCINTSSLLKIRTEKIFEESTVSKILELVENAVSRKSSSERFISRFAKIYTPIVCLLSALLAVVPPLLSLAFTDTSNFDIWLYRALTFLVISCPCALVISIPLGFFAGIGAAGKDGILIKGSNYLELLSELEYVVFDKTGTLTEGKFSVTETVCEGISRHGLLEYSAHAEYFSSHPISQCIKDAYGKEINHKRVSSVKETGGGGIECLVDGKRVAVGNLRLMNGLGIPCPACDSPHTCVYVAIEKKYAGVIIISDKIKENAKAAIQELKALGIKKTVILTGDSEKVANMVAKELYTDEYISQLLPEDKVLCVESLLEEKSSSKRLAFVGDGINDAPVLARADIGIAMGALGSDAAIEAADIVLMHDDLYGIVKAIRISKKTLRIARQNIIFSIGIKIICLLLVAAGFADMWLGIFADVGVMILAILNATRAFRTNFKK